MSSKTNNNFQKQMDTASEALESYVQCLKSILNEPFDESIPADFMKQIIFVLTRLLDHTRDIRVDMKIVQTFAKDKGHKAILGADGVPRRMTAQEQYALTQQKVLKEESY